MNRIAAQNIPEARIGVLLGLSAYIFWGFFPIYFKTVAGVPPLEVVAHRIVWSLFFLVLLVTWNRRWQEIRRALSTPRTLLMLTGTTLLIAVNWLVFIYAVGHGEVLQSSLGYFITPLVNVLLGFLFLHERLRTWQKISLLLATIGVLFPAIHYGKLPWISLILAVSFGLYGLLRKVAPVDSVVGLTVETLITGPPALAYIIYLCTSGASSFLAGSATYNVFLPLAGVITAIPLILFAAAARRLRLSTIGFLQYITPSLHFLLAVWAFGETFTFVHLVSFIFIWSGLALYSVAALRTAR